MYRRMVRSNASCNSNAMINIVNVKSNVLNIMRAICPLIYLDAKIVSDKVMIECATPKC